MSADSTPHPYILLKSLVFIFLFSLLLSACSQKTTTFTPEERHTIDSIVRTVRYIDSFAGQKARFDAQGNKLGAIVTLREWGKFLRNESRFEEALKIHSQGLHEAETLGDTIEWVQALNNIGTNYRRLGILDAAQEYHYQAWKLSERCKDTSFRAKKNRVVSLNGLGNIYIVVGNYERADSVFRKALAGEKELKSNFGQALNYANIGTIFKNKSEIDSAWVYYRRAMELNQKEKTFLGISLCHTYFGELYEMQGDYPNAYKEYETAYELMKASKDEWHALQSVIALSEIDLKTHKNTQSLQRLAKAEAIAQKINSRRHLAQIYELYYQNYTELGNYQRALADYERATALKDSIVGREKMNRIQNLSLNIERKHQMEKMRRVEQDLQKERTRKYMYLGGGLLLVFSLLGFVLMLQYVQRVRARSFQALKKMNDLRENFFTNITHEFRTPLTVILGLSHEIATDPKTGKNTLQKAQAIEHQGKNLLSFINQLLDISKVKTAVGDPDWRKGDLSAYLTMIVESYRDYAHSKEIELQFNSEGAVEADFVPDYINKIMNNLLSNAFKFTPQYGKIVISLTSENNQFTIKVSDTGKGISKEALTHLFELFYQEENNVGQIGSGIGLSLVKQIVEALQGTIEVTSTEGKGTTFTVVLPLLHNKAIQTSVQDDEQENIPLLPQQTTELHDSDTSDDNAERILIIEDNPDVALYIASQLPKEYAVFYAQNGKEGLEKAEDMMPDLIITDLMMPDLDGLGVCKAVRNNEILSHIPIIVITAKVTETDRIKGLEAGADAYLAKPFNTDELQMRVTKLLEQRRALRQKYLLGTVETDTSDTQTNDTDQLFLLKMVDYIYLLLDKGDEVDIPQIASKMCMSTRQLYRKINALTGYAPQGYIQRIKIRKAQQLLEKDSEKSLKEVAEECGFTDYSSFARAFKNVTGTTPRQVKGKAGE